MDVAWILENYSYSHHILVLSFCSTFRTLVWKAVISKLIYFLTVVSIPPASFVGDECLPSTLLSSWYDCNTWWSGRARAWPSHFQYLQLFLSCLVFMSPKMALHVYQMMLSYQLTCSLLLYKDEGIKLLNIKKQSSFWLLTKFFMSLHDKDFFFFN